MKFSRRTGKYTSKFTITAKQIASEIGVYGVYVSAFNLAIVIHYQSALSVLIFAVTGVSLIMLAIIKLWLDAVLADIVTQHETIVEYEKYHDYLRNNCLVYNFSGTHKNWNKIQFKALGRRRRV
jgi:hypothetical protein